MITTHCFRHVTRHVTQRAPARAGGPPRTEHDGTAEGPDVHSSGFDKLDIEVTEARDQSGNRQEVNDRSCRQFACYGAVVYGNAVLSRQSGAIQNALQIRLIVDNLAELTGLILIFCSGDIRRYAEA
jgi:hypothetical protein